MLLSDWLGATDNNEMEETELKKLFAFILAIVMLLSLAACGNAGGDTKSGTKTDGKADSSTKGDGTAATVSDDGETLNIAIAGDDGTLSPVNSASKATSVIYSMYEPLWDVDTHNNVTMLLAESIEDVSDSEKLIHIRKGVKFHNGSDLTASDVLFSMNLHKAAGAWAQPRVQVVDFENTKVADEYTLDLVMVAPSVALYTILSQCMIYDEETYDESTIALNPNGTGAFKLVKYVPNSELDMERFDGYWGEAPAYKYINCKILAEDSQRMNALETGMIDVATISKTDAEYAKSLENIFVTGNYEGNFFAVHFNLGPNSPLHKNTKARLAICHAIDRNAILQTVFMGLGKEIHASTSDICFDYNAEKMDNISDTYALGYDVELAKQLAEESGLAGQEIIVIISGGNDETRVAEMIQGMLSQIGVTLKINSYDPAVVSEMVYSLDGDWAFMIGAGMAPNRRVGDQLYNGVRFMPGNTYENSFENNAEYFALAPQAMSIVDPVKSEEFLCKMLKWYEDEALSFALCDLMNFKAYSKTVDPDSIRISVGTSDVVWREIKPLS